METLFKKSEELSRLESDILDNAMKKAAFDQDRLKQLQSLLNSGKGRLSASTEEMLWLVNSYHDSLLRQMVLPDRTSRTTIDAIKEVIADTVSRSNGAAVENLIGVSEKTQYQSTAAVYLNALSAIDLGRYTGLQADATIKKKMIERNELLKALQSLDATLNKLQSAEGRGNFEVGPDIRAAGEKYRRKAYALKASNDALTTRLEQYQSDVVAYQNGQPSKIKQGGDVWKAIVSGKSGLGIAYKNYFKYGILTSAVKKLPLLTAMFAAYLPIGTWSGLTDALGNSNATEAERAAAWGAEAGLTFGTTGYLVASLVPLYIDAANRIQVFGFNGSRPLVQRNPALLH